LFSEIEKNPLCVPYKVPWKKFLDLICDNIKKSKKNVFKLDYFYKNTGVFLRYKKRVPWTTFSNFFRLTHHREGMFLQSIENMKL
jgi:hypothetical protein